MSIHSPAQDWYHAPEGNEKLWIGLAVGWCVVMTLMMPYWHFMGKQNSTGDAIRTTPQAFVERHARFVEANQLRDADNKVIRHANGQPIVQPAPGSDVYLLARTWFFSPVLKLREGETYRLHLSSADLNHGFSLQPMNMNFQIVPGYDHILTITPTSSGEFDIVCNEFCGIGHHLMVGKLIVEK